MMNEVRPGQKTLSAEALNDGIKGGRLAIGTRVRGGNQTQIPGAGQIIDASQRQKRKDVGTRTVRPVIIRKSPSPNAGWVTVQEVQYIDWPVKPCDDTGCRIQAFGPTIEARPFFGKKDKDDSDAVLTGDTIDTSTKFFEITWDGRLWMLDFPQSGGSNIGLCLVHAGYTGSWGSTRYLRVVHVKYNALGGNYISAERQTPIAPETVAPGYSIVQTWPGTNESYWQYFQSTTGTAPNFGPSANAVYFGTVMIGGVEYIAPIVPIASLGPNPNYLAGDC